MIRDLASAGTVMEFAGEAVARLPDGTLAGSEAEELFHQLAGAIPQVLFVRSAAPPKLLYLSKAFETIWGLPRAEVYRRYEVFLESIHPDDRERTYAALAQVNAGASVDLNYRILRPGGEVRHLASQLRPLRDASGRCDRVVGIVEDVSGKVEAAANLHSVNALLQQALLQAEARACESARLAELVEMLQSCQNMDEACKVAERSLGAIFQGLPGAIAVMRASRNVLEFVAHWGAPSLETVFPPDDCWALRLGKPFVAEAVGPRCRHARGNDRYICVPLAAQSDTFGLLWQQLPAVSVGADEKEDTDRVQTVAARMALALANVRLREALRNQSIQDPLTGLYNRRYLEVTFERELERARVSHTPLVLAMVDLDHFKRFNDDFGHGAGDVVLREVAGVLRAHLRGGDCCCRFGGEEFVFLLLDTPLETAHQRLETLRSAIHELAIGDRARAFGRISISAGLAAFPDHGNRSETLLAAADAALYRAKQEGRDRVLVAPQ